MTERNCHTCHHVSIWKFKFKPQPTRLASEILLWVHHVSLALHSILGLPTVQGRIWEGLHVTANCFAKGSETDYWGPKGQGCKRLHICQVRAHGILLQSNGMLPWIFDLIRPSDDILETQVYLIRTLPSGETHFKFLLLFFPAACLPKKNASDFLRDTVVNFIARATPKSSTFGLSKTSRLLYRQLHCLGLLVSFFYHFLTRMRVYEWKKRTAVSLTRLPAAVADSFRTIAYRWTIPVGSSHELNLVEVGLTLAYMAVLFTWTFVNSMLHLFISA